MPHKLFQSQLTEAQSRAIFQIAEDAIVSVDSNHRIILFNEGAERTFGYGQNEILGRELELLIPESNRDNHAQQLQRFADSVPRARRMGERGEICGLRKDGTEFPMEASICVIGHGDELVFTAILRDISERKAQTEEVAQSQETCRIGRLRQEHVPGQHEPRDQNPSQCGRRHDQPVTRYPAVRRTTTNNRIVPTRFVPAARRCLP
jgi:PAS domain S-box-containing protein